MSRLGNIALTDYDLRQLELMRGILKAYDAEKISLSDVINKLEGLFECLQFSDNEWKTDFHTHWFTLEQVYAVALDRNEPLSYYESYLIDSMGELRNLLTV
ncbi:MULTISPECIES: hypothetical protein [Pantoea]|jgi:DNA-binding IscR family transcriptional regulator|uniref:hypothetical protein n=1 Tax=Pantoea TaxID=53335 RepID=UPI001C063445|nr:MULTISPECIES: hypothetical protein [Pantoea]